MRPIKEIIVHCSDSTFGDVVEIRRWHTMPPPQGRGWRDIGYHFVIDNGQLVPKVPFDASKDGFLEVGRPVDEVGAHCEGHNQYSIGVCLVGINTFSVKQMEVLYAFLADQMKKYGLKVSDIRGHYETNTGKAQGKTCPNMDMDKVRAELIGRQGQG